MTLSKAVEQYITVKRSLGFRFQTESVILAAFSKAIGTVHLGQIKPGAVRAYLDGHGPVTRHWYRKWETLRLFYRFAMARGLVQRSPLPTNPPKLGTTFTPYIYTQAELQALLQAITPERTGRVSSQTVRALLLLLYGAAYGLVKRCGWRSVMWIWRSASFAFAKASSLKPDGCRSGQSWRRF